MDWLRGKGPLIIGHRGASADAPENTLFAFALAKEQGADGVELDVQLSADNEIVIFHDATIDRTTDGSGAVADLTRVELQEFDAGQGQQIPTLDELFAAFGPTLLYNIEIKAFGWRGGTLERTVADRVQAYHLEKQVVISSFNPLVVRRARRYFTRSTMIALLRQPGWLSYTKLLARGEAEHPHYSLVDESYMQSARKQGLRVHVWTVNDGDVAGEMAHLGVHGIITDNPGRMRDYV